MVALNFQTPDKAMQWNRGKFKQNGSCGYLLKPSFMLSVRRESKTPLESAMLKRTDYVVQIIGARHLRKDGTGQMFPFVEIEIIGADADCQKVKTTRQESGLNPCWNETFQMKVSCPELALLQFCVSDLDLFGDIVLLGEATIPIPCIRMGYRSIQLNNAYGSPLLSSLLVRIGINDSG